MSAAAAASTSRQTPGELVAIGERVGLDGAALARASRLVAKVDSAAVQDGFELYLHGFIVADDGHWVVVQQGMNGDRRAGAALSLAVGGPGELRRRAACRDRGRGTGRDRQPDRPPRRRIARRRSSICSATSGPDGIVRELAPHRGERRRLSPQQSRSRCCRIWSCRRITTCGRRTWSSRRLHGTLAAAADRGPADFAELLLVPGVGARTVRALAMVAEVVHGAPCRFTDPARFSLAHGGKDRHPFPVPTQVYDRTIAVMKSAVRKARLGHEEELAAIQRLDDQARRLERTSPGPRLRP